MPSRRFDRLPPDRRAAILQAAAEEFAVHGFEAASLNRLVDRIGISKGSLYYYFDSKDDLFSTVADEAWRVMLPAEPPNLDDLDAATFWPTMADIVATMTDQARKHPWLAGVAAILYSPPASDRVQQAVAEQFARSHAWIDRMLARGQELGVVRDDLPRDLVASILIAAAEAADRWTVQHWTEISSDELPALSEILFSILLGIVMPGGVRHDA